MGTNFYARTNICKDCKRYDEIHIGKSSVGWTFSFHATEKIRSYKDWVKFLKQEGVEIFNEYGEEIMLDKFMLLVEAKKKEKNNHALQYTKGSFIDKEGHSFTEGWFA